MKVMSIEERRERIKAFKLLTGNIGMTKDEKRRIIDILYKPTMEMFGEDAAYGLDQSLRSAAKI